MTEERRKDLSAEEFERRYAERSKVTVERLRELGRVVRACDCGDPDCKGWQSISLPHVIHLDKLEALRQQVRAIVEHFGGCAQCREEHGGYPESVSCYCSCHDGAEGRWPDVKAMVEALLP